MITKEMELYKPLKSTRKNKKYMVKTKKGVIHFGDSRYSQFHDKLGVYSNLNNNDPKRKKAYYARHGTTKDKDTALYWSNKVLW